MTTMPTSDADAFGLYGEIEDFVDMAAQLYDPSEVVPVLEALVREWKGRATNADKE